jgi:hypothetical protein
MPWVGRGGSSLPHADMAWTSPTTIWVSAVTQAMISRGDGGPKSKGGSKPIARSGWRFPFERTTVHAMITATLVCITRSLLKTRDAFWKRPDHLPQQSCSAPRLFSTTQRPTIASKRCRMPCKVYARKSAFRSSKRFPLSQNVRSGGTKPLKATALIPIAADILLSLNSFTNGLSFTDGSEPMSDGRFKWI